MSRRKAQLVKAAQLKHAGRQKASHCAQKKRKKPKEDGRFSFNKEPSQNTRQARKMQDLNMVIENTLLLNGGEANVIYIMLCHVQS